MTPAKTISVQPWMSEPGACAVLAALALESQRAALFVGGCVRDALLDRDVVDLDIATIHPPEEVIQRLNAVGIGYHTIGVDHGTVGAHAGGRIYEITTLRVDVETDGRHATVAYTDDWVLDASRRDFTLNALYADGEGNVFDPLGGMDDLKACRVRFIGDPHERIQEDTLRILRFFRFNAQLGNVEMDADGLLACRSQAKMLQGLSGERVRDELRKLLLSARPARTFAVMVENKILPDALSGLNDVEALAALAQIEDRQATPDFVRRLSALFDGTSDMSLITTQLRVSKVEERRLLSLGKRSHDLCPDMSPNLQRQRLYRLGSEAWRDQVVLNWAKNTRDENENGAETWCALLGLPDVWPMPVFPVRGTDVMAAEVAQGSEIGRLLDAIEAWWIEGGFVANREACLVELARRAGC
jgi:poly(A) polymerase